MAEREGLFGPGSVRYVILVLVLALVLRVALIFNMGNSYFFADTGEYDVAARNLLAGHGLGSTLPRAPLFPAEMALGFLLGGIGNFRAVRELQLVIGLLVVFQCGRLGALIGGPRVGRLTLLAAAIAPTLVFTTGLLYPTALYTLLLLTATLLLWELSRRPSVVGAVALGLTLALTWLTDQIVMVPAAFLFAWLLGALIRQGRSGIAVFATAVLVVMITVGAWVRYNETHYGRSGLFFAKAQYVLYYARHDTSMNRTRIIRDTGEFHPLPMDSLAAREMGYLAAHPLGYVTDYAREFVHFFDPWPDRLQTSNNFTRRELLWIGAIYITPVLLLAFIGLAFGWASRRDRLLLALVPLSTAFIYSFFLTQTRYRIPSEPQLIALAALGLQVVRPGWVAWLSGLPAPARVGAPTLSEPAPAKRA